jgi:DeoR/GlpR family transcriptional regulator of sugar metabolism
LDQKVRERADVRRLLRVRHQDFNHRQLALIELALDDASAEVTVVSHASSHQVTPETARRDLLDLAERGILVRGKRGRAFVWRPAPDARQSLGR